MTMNHTNELTPRKPLRLWPAVAIAIVQLLVMFGAPVVAPDAGCPSACLRGVVGALAIVVWWLLFSRAPWFERVGAIVLMIVAVLATRAVAHESIVGAGQGMLIYILPTPYLALALVAWAVATRHLQDGVRRASLVAAILLVCAPFALIRTAGITGGAGSEFHWRWTPTPEQRLLAQGGDEPKPLPPSAAPASSAAPAEIPKETPAARASVTPAAVPAAPAAAKIEAAAPAATDDAGRVAGLSRARARQRRSRRADRDGLDEVAAGRDLAPADRTGMVILRGARRSPLYAGAAR